MRKHMHERLAYTISEACDVMRIGRTKLYELLADKKLKAVAFGGRTLILHDEASRFLADLPPVQLRARERPGKGSAEFPNAR
jgi:excisionase family DNA binding protein